MIYDMIELSLPAGGAYFLIFLLFITNRASEPQILCVISSCDVCMIYFDFSVRFNFLKAQKVS